MSISPFQKMADRWPSTIVFRSKIEEFTGGGFSPGYMANLDSRGEGPGRLIRCGRKIGYPVEDLVAWLEDRCQEVAAKRPASQPKVLDV
jgi:hypothetical protein